MKIRHWLLQLLIAIDQLANVLITPGSPGAWADETLSSRAWRMERKGKAFGRLFRPLIDALFRLGGREHCRKSYEGERLGRDLPPELRA